MLFLTSIFSPRFNSHSLAQENCLVNIDNYIIKSHKAKDYNTNAIINAMKNNNIFIITHPGDKGDVYIEEIAKIAKKTDTRLEVNSSHGFLTVEQLKIKK